jgi:hypothetical protein
MRITAIVDERGQLVAATTGPVADPVSIAEAAGGEAGGGVELTKGQTAREVEVSDTLFENGDVEEFLRHISEQLS